MTGTDTATVLIVEDEAELAAEYADWLREYTVHTAHTGEEALDRLEAEPVDVVLLDRRLPDRPGSEVLSVIRERGHDCRVAMITAVDPDFDVLEMPIDDYVVKPVLGDDLRELVDSLLQLADYDELVQESFSIASKLRAIAAGERAEEAADHDEYQRLRERLRTLRDDLDASIEGFDERELDRVYRDIEGSGAEE